MTPPMIPSWQLYGEDRAFPDILHIERVTARAAGLDWHIAPHRHLFLHQFFLILDGHVQFQADGLHQDLRLPAVLSIPSPVVHGFTFAQGTEGFVLTLPMQGWPELFAGDPRVSQPLARVMNGAASPDLQALFRQTEAEYSTTGPVRTVLLRALAAQIGAMVLRICQPADQASGPQPDPRITAFQSLLLAHFRQRWTVGAYAQALNISPRHLSRLCQAAFGHSAERQIEQITFHEACRLLVYTRANASSVGYALGFDDPSYFSRAFQKHTGLSPSAYRQKFES